jgi:hypothetical protein
MRKGGKDASDIDDFVASRRIATMTADESHAIL